MLYYVQPLNLLLYACALTHIQRTQNGAFLLHCSNRVAHLLILRLTLISLYYIPPHYLLFSQFRYSLQPLFSVHGGGGGNGEKGQKYDKPNKKRKSILLLYVKLNSIGAYCVAFETTQMRWPHSHSYTFRLNMSFAVLLTARRLDRRHTRHSNREPQLRRSAGRFRRIHGRCPRSWPCDSDAVATRRCLQSASTS